jgi:FAD/FMN-containing dehydrogenase
LSAQLRSRVIHGPDLGGIDPGLVIDPERRTVTAGAGTNYGVLANYLHRAGWALHNMASLPDIYLTEHRRWAQICMRSTPGR